MAEDTIESISDPEGFTAQRTTAPEYTPCRYDHRRFDRIQKESKQVDSSHFVVCTQIQIAARPQIFDFSRVPWHNNFVIYNRHQLLVSIQLSSLVSLIPKTSVSRNVQHPLPACSVARGLEGIEED
jgi:hypothetical protein